MEKVRSISQSHLEPFPHQVAGQSLVFRYDAHTICKSLIDRELKVYQTLPDILKPYVPQYRGVVDVALNGPRPDREEEEEEEEKGERGGGGVEHPLTTQRLLDKVAKRQGHDNVYHFLLLENIVAGYQRPCVLDLKLGTRQHGDDAPRHKVLYQLDKCRNTTSALLGVRLCGMKVYQSATGNYVKVDKTEGRRMGEDDFREAMRQFLFNGRHIRRELIPLLLLKLQRLKAAISEMSSFRFYSSSLLIVYDGLEFSCEGKHVSLDTCPSVSVNGVPENGSGNHCYPPHVDKHSIVDSAGVTASREGLTRGTDDGTCVHIPPSFDNSDDNMAESVGLVPSRAGQADACQVSVGAKSNQEDDRSTQKTTAAYGGERKENRIPNGESVTKTHISSSQNSDRDSQKCDIGNVLSSDKVIARDDGNVWRSERSALQNFEDNNFRISDRDAVVSSSAMRKGTDAEKERMEEEMVGGDMVNGHSAMTATDRGTTSVLADKLTCDCCSRLMDVRMVDFAHTTHAGFHEDSVVYQGPDQGYLLGLHTLIQTFTHIYTSTADQEP